MRFATKNPVLEFDVKAGKFYMELYPDAAPRTCSSILYLARSGFYEKTYFHRRIENFVLQGGDPFTRDLPPDDDRIGKGGPDYKVPGEFSATLTHQRGTVGLARAPKDPDSGGSQFYICLVPVPALDREYCIFGKIIAGMDVVDKTQIGDRIKKVSVVQGAEPTNPPGAQPLELFAKPTP
jgi:cyclophilin family peptidyl-prolyl cis-trans isomerase